MSLLPKAPLSEQESDQVRQGVTVRTNGAAHANAASGVAVGAPPARQQKARAKGSLFDSLWPKSQRASPQIQTAVAVPAIVPPPPPPGAQPTQEPASAGKPAAAPQPMSVAASILKSGVVEGMAYTLYSDGSIEAELPGGALRFRSITELRNHIEQNS